MLRQMIGCVAATAAFSFTAGAASLLVDNMEPAGNVVVANPHVSFTSATPGPVGQRDTFSTIFPASAGTQIGARGQTFYMPSTGSGLWNLSRISLLTDIDSAGVATAQDLSTSPSTLRLWLFEFNPNTSGTDGSQWTLGDGSSDSDPFDGTGTSNFLIDGETFDVTRTFNGEFLHFLTPGVQLSADTAYGFLLALESSITTGLRIDDVRDATAPTGQAYLLGAILSSGNTANAINSNGDDLVFYISATPVPEPCSLVLLGLGLGSLFIRRR